MIEMVLALAWTFGANGFLVEHQLAGVETLPVAWLEPVADRVHVVFHAREDWAMAFYDASGATPAPAGDALAGGSSANGPRLTLFAPFYLAPGGLVEPSQMPVDVAEYYFHALIEAALDIERESAYAGFMGERAVELMAEVPVTHRSSAYGSALADFGAHLLSIRNEIARLAERRAAAGGDLCGLLDQPASLFGLWRRSIDSGTYAGSYFSAGDDGPPRWVQSRRALDRSDKDRFLAEILGVDWSGDPARDFAAICSGL